MRLVEELLHMMGFPLRGQLQSICTSMSVKAKTLFATHYHELNEMTEQFDRIKNYNVAVKEIDGKIIFIRTLKGRRIRA